MHVLTLTWEFPPHTYGGLGRHVDGLTAALAAAGHEITVVAPGQPPAVEPVGTGLRRVVGPDPDEPVAPLPDLLAHVATLGHALARAALRSGEGGRGYDVLHAHDWVVGQAAATVQDALGLPLVVTVHATEAGRHQGWLPGPLSRAIHGTEGWLVGRADRVIVCSSAMEADVGRLFAVPDERLRIVPNAVDVAAWPAGPSAAARGPVVVFAGRLEYEKGVHVLLQAVPRLRRRVPRLSVVVAGTGTYEGELHALARRLRLGRAVRFVGRLEDAALGELYRSAAVVALPSIYEPSGLVALEAAASGAPLVISDVGGLAEFAAACDPPGVRTVPPDDVAALADAITELLRDRQAAAALAQQARRHVPDWEMTAKHTTVVYEEAWAGPAVQRYLPPMPPEGMRVLG